jgi:hypothetical protein
MKYFIIAILITTTACSHRQLPHNQPLHRDVAADIINKNEYEKQAQAGAEKYYWVLDETGHYVVNNNYKKQPLNIVDRNEALDLLNSEVK